MGLSRTPQPTIFLWEDLDDGDLFLLCHAFGGSSSYYSFFFGPLTKVLSLSVSYLMHLNAEVLALGSRLAEPLSIYGNGLLLILMSKLVY